MGSLAQTIAKLQALKLALSRPTEFYSNYLPQWQEHAQRITVAILRHSRPPETDPDDWQRRIETEAARLSALLFFDADEIGAILSLGIRPPVPQSDPRHYTLDNMSVKDIERWVEAGRGKQNPDDPGKNLDERDDGKTDPQIAWRIIYALKLRKEGWERLLGHIEDFLGLEAGAAPGLYREILQAWLEQIGPQIRADYRAWIHGRITAAMR
jgi:hypothetical protein